jgi:hypothetical protein
MRIRVVGHSGESVFPFGTSGPWVAFRDTIISKGHQITNSDFGAEVDALIAHRHSIEALREADDNGVPRSRRALVVWEPEIVEKERYSVEVLKNYGVIYAPSPIWASKVSGKSFRWPQDAIVGISPQRDWIKRKNKFVIIQGNKFSARKGELYSLRRKVIKGLNEKVDLYGTNWNKGVRFDWWHWSRSAIRSNLKEISIASISGIGRHYANYFGETSFKKETLANYRLAIVIENSSDFVSEKLFDAISAGCLAIYVGPILEEFGIDESKIIVCPESRSEIINACLEIQKLDVAEQYRKAQAQNAFLKTISGSWENREVLKILARDILEDMD